MRRPRGRNKKRKNGSREEWRHIRGTEPRKPRKEVKRELEVKVNEEVAKKLAEIKSNIRSLRKDSDDFDN